MKTGVLLINLGTPDALNPSGPPLPQAVSE